MSNETVSDTVVDTHDRIVGKIWRDAKKLSTLHFEQAQANIASTLGGFESLGGTLMMARGDDAALIGAVDASCGWDGLENPDSV